MDALKQKILSEGRVKGDHILLVDSFLNHQVDPKLMEAVGEAFAEIAAPLMPTRVATIESSGIAPAQMTALKLGVPLVIMKKSPSKILSDGILQATVFSFTKNNSYQLTVKGEFIHPGDRVLLIDDFLATGEAALGAIKLIEARGAAVAAVGIVIEKSFQPGRKLLEGRGHRICSLARIARMGGGRIEFLE